MKSLIKFFSRTFVVIILFLGTIEGLSWIIVSSGFRKSSRGPEFTVNNWNDVQKFSMQNDRIGDLSRLLLQVKSRYPEISVSRIIDETLRQEPPNYTNQGEKTRQHLFRGPGLIAKNINDEFVLRGLITNREKYRVRYITDSFGRRVTGSDDRVKATENIIFLGCSFTFGEGVSQEENFAARIAQRYPNVRVYNFGSPGTGPSVILKNILTYKSELFQGIDFSLPTKFIFTYIDDHVRRVIGTSVLFKRGEYGYLYEPYFYLKEDDSLGFDESFSKRFSNLRWLYRGFGKTNFSTLTQLELPIYSTEHFRLIARIMGTMRNELRKYAPRSNLYFSFYPGSNHYLKNLLPVLEDEKIPVLTYNFFDDYGLLGNWHINGVDSHPSALAHDLYASFLDYDIKRLKVIENRGQ